MKKIKLIIIIVIVFLASGCTATYELSIKDNKVIENLKIVETNISLFDVRMDSGWTLRETFESLSNGDQFTDENYKIRSLNTSSQLGVEYKSDSLNSVINSSILNQCYINPSVTELDGIITIDTGNNFKCFEYYENLETIEIIFETNHEIVSTNAQKTDGNKYIWNFTEDSDKQIIISYYEDFVKKSLDWASIVIISIMVVLVSIFAYFLIKKYKESNEI